MKTSFKALGESLGRLQNVSGGRQLLNLELSKLDEDPDNVRKEFDKKALSELADSIREVGIIQPLVVVPLGGGRYRIHAGARRFRAAQLAGLERVPAVTRETPDQARETQLIENIHREDLSPLEIARALKSLMGENKEYGTVAAVAKKVGMPREWASRHLSLLDASEGVQQLAEENPDVGVRRLLSLDTLDSESRAAEIEAITSRKPAASEQVPSPTSPSPFPGAGDKPASKSDAPARSGQEESAKKPAAKPKATKENTGAALPKNVSDAFDALAKATGVRAKIAQRGDQYVVTLPMTAEQLEALAKRFR